jgi:hypothetical protein
MEGIRLKADATDGGSGWEEIRLKADATGDAALEEVWE